MRWASCGESHKLSARQRCSKSRATASAAAARSATAGLHTSKLRCFQRDVNNLYDARSQLATTGRARRSAPAAFRLSARSTPRACGSARQLTAPVHRAQGQRAPGPSTGGQREQAERARQQHAPPDAAGGTGGPTLEHSTCAATCARASVSPTRGGALSRSLARYRAGQLGLGQNVRRRASARRGQDTEGGNNWAHTHIAALPSKPACCNRARTLVWLSGVQRSAKPRRGAACFALPQQRQCVPFAPRLQGARPACAVR